MPSNGCNNARNVDRKALKSRVLVGLRERMMTPEIVLVIEQRGWHRALSDRLTEIEAKQHSLTAH